MPEQVAVVGSFVVGLTLRADRFPVSGETVLARDFDMGPGGKGSNQAVQVARLGLPVEFIGVIGHDDFGTIATSLFEDEGVGRTHLTTVGNNTGVGFIVLDSAGNNRILLDPGSNDLFSPDHVRAATSAIEGSRVLLTQLELPVGTAREGLSIGRSSGCITILNPAPARPLADDVFELVDVLTPNQTEARALLGLAADDEQDDLSICGALLERGVSTVVLTRGEEGAVIVDESGTTFIPAFAVDVVDSTGAGDAFNGALAAALAVGVPLPAAVRRGAAAGALACTRLGVIPALPHADELEKLLES